MSYNLTKIITSPIPSHSLGVLIQSGHISLTDLMSDKPIHFKMPTPEEAYPCLQASYEHNEIGTQIVSMR